MTDPLPPGATIGILGGGQLGRMLAVAASRLGYLSHIYEPGAAPAAQVAQAWIQAPYDDAAALVAFARSVDVVTYEFENVPADALDVIEAEVPIRPGRRALVVSQDRQVEKTYLSGLGLATAPFAPVDDEGSLSTALDRIGTPAILKTRRFGYDGKGQAPLATPDDAAAALSALAGAPAVLEGHVDFAREISVIVARSLSGEVAAFDPGENVHEGGILRRTTVPAAISSAQRADAVLLAGRIVTELDYVGVLGVELFVTRTGLVVNEIAPRVHNSGHWTQNGCAVDQFEQHIRAITGHPLGDGRRYADVTMENLIGGDIARVAELARTPDVALHLYGKAEARPGRKMGHINRIHAATN
ncbi:MAG: 5-(carboxyamino)imidazole ribonucleotide synthase [Pseudomonadota bacterium]